MGRPVRVCHVSLTLGTGGLERLLAGLARHHNREICQLEFLALADGGRFAEEIRDAGCDVFVLGEAAEEQIHEQQTVHREVSSSRLSRIVQMRRRFADRRYDIVHTHNIYPHLYATVAARWAGVPVVINTRHGQRVGHGWKSRCLFRLASRWVDRIVAVSDDAARLCVQVDGIPIHKVTRIWNGIDTQAFAESAHRREPIAISVARLSPEKDFPTLLAAIVLAQRFVPNLRLRIVGDGPERSRLQSLSERLGIADRVQFLGERTDVAQQLAEAGFFVTSSRSEGISLTLLEAMACGLPVVATDVGGNAEIVGDAALGQLVPPANPKRLAEAIVELCGRVDQWPAMGSAARRSVAQRFDARRMVSDYEQLYEQLCPIR